MKKYFAFFFASCLMVGFQNCGAPIQFQEAAASGDLSLGDTVKIGNDNGGTTGGDVSNPIPPSEDGSGPGGDGTEATMPVVTDEPVDGVLPGEDPIVAPPTDSIGELPTDPVTPPGEEVDPFSCAGLGDAKVATTNECKAAIADASKILTLDNGVSVRNFTGNFKGKSGHIVTIENTKGNLLLVGIGKAYVEKIIDTKGNLTICNMDIGSIESVSAGNISIDGGNVCSVVGHKGNVKVNNGSVGEVNYNKGNITVTNGDVGNINAHTGNIMIKGGTVKGTITNSIGNIRISK